ncbi:MAG: hypothetical protein ACNS61_11035 [Candidatus Wenzhouxiangella sp. M2_3B_020]
MKFRKLALPLLAALLPIQAIAGETHYIEAEVVESTIETFGDDIISYDLRDNHGGVTYMEYDLGTGRWLSVDPSGRSHSGLIPAKLVDGHQMGLVPLPCFAGPVAAATCIGVTVVAGTAAYFACSRMTDEAIRRAQSQCPPGSTAEIHRIGRCGVIESGGCVPLDRFDNGERDDGVDP